MAKNIRYSTLLLAFLMPCLFLFSPKLEYKLSTDVKDNEAVTSVCHITNGSEVIVEVLETCHQLRVDSPVVADKIRAAYPEFDANLIRHDDRSWFGEWWRQHQQISYPRRDPVPCKNAVTRQFSNFFGSQTFVDLKHFFYSGRTLVRHLDPAKNLYTKDSLVFRNESQAMTELRSCLRTHGTGETNDFACLFLPPTDCLPSSNNDSFVRISREKSFCGKYENETVKQTACLEELAKPAPVEPVLKGSLSPDVSLLGVNVLERMVATSSFLRNALDEIKNPVLANLKHPCVAIHIRRGDKLPECGRGKKASCAFLKNLTDYTDEAVKFLDQMGGGSMFAMTDDPTFVKGIESVDGYRFLSLAGKTAPDVRASDGLQELVLLLVSLEIAGTCDAIVGNSESEVSELAVLFRCVNGGGACPPVYSMNGRPLQAYEGVIVDGRASNVKKG